MNFFDIVRAIKRYSEGHLPADYERRLRLLASSLKKDYNVEPVDIIAAISMFNEGRSSYGFHLLRRAFKDLVRIGRQNGWLTYKDMAKLRYGR